MNFTRRLFACGLPAMLLLSTSSSVRAQGQRDTARLLCGYPPGGALDTICRTLAVSMSGGYARTVVVDSKPGAAGRLAVEETRQAASNGSTILLTPASVLTMYPHLYRNLAYDPLQDLLPLSLIAAFGFALVVGPKVPGSVRDVRQFLAWCKANPRSAECGNPGAGSFPHFMAMLLARDGGVDLTHVPFKGGSAALQDVAAGQVSAALLTEPGVAPLIKAGRVRSLATSWTERSPFQPEVATFREQGFDALTQREWFGAFVRSGTAPSVVEVAATSVQAAARRADARSAWHEINLVAEGSTASELDENLRREHAFWGPVIRASGFTVDS